MTTAGAIIFSAGALLLAPVIFGRMSDSNNPFSQTLAVAVALIIVGGGMML
jgi:hypothetical protein